MKLGISLPQIGQQAGAENLIRAAQRAEELGYDSVWTLERILWPVNPQDAYLPDPEGKLPEAYQTVFDPIETLTFVAAHTRRVRLGTSVLVLGYHTPIELARRISTLDQLSEGRVDLGVGVGWSRDEFEAAGTPFEKRGARADEFLRAMIDLWTKDPVGFEGKFYRIPESKIGPKPAQKPHPPIYVAGFGPYTFERAARFGAGWNPALIAGFEELEAQIKEFQKACEQAGRGRLEVVLRAYPLVMDQSPGSERGPLVGTLAEIAADIRRLRDIGVTYLLHSPPEIGFFPTPDIDLGLKRMEQLMEISR